jgi:hypothetical protein
MIGFAPFLMVIGIVWVRGRQQIEEKRIAAGQARGDTDSTSRQVAGRVDELAERVRVLERIVTDGGYDLAHKIEALRDGRGVEELVDDRRERSPS